MFRRKVSGLDVLHFKSFGSRLVIRFKSFGLDLKLKLNINIQFQIQPSCLHHKIDTIYNLIKL